MTRHQLCIIIIIIFFIFLFIFYFYLFFIFFILFFFKLPTVLSSRGIYKIGGKEKCVFHRPSSVGQKLSNEPANEMALHL